MEQLTNLQIEQLTSILKRQMVIQNTPPESPTIKSMPSAPKEPSNRPTADATFNSIIALSMAKHGDGFRCSSDNDFSSLEAEVESMLDDVDISDRLRPTSTDIRHAFRETQADVEKSKLLLKLVCRVKTEFPAVWIEAKAMIDNELIEHGFSREDLEGMAMRKGKASSTLFVSYNTRYLAGGRGCACSAQEAFIDSIQLKLLIEHRIRKEGVNAIGLRESSANASKIIFEVHVVSVRNNNTPAMNHVKLQFERTTPASEFLAALQESTKLSCFPFVEFRPPPSSLEEVDPLSRGVFVPSGARGSTTSSTSLLENSQRTAFERDMLSKPSRTIPADRGFTLCHGPWLYCFIPAHSSWDPAIEMASINTEVDFDLMLYKWEYYQELQGTKLEIVVRHLQDKKIHDGLVERQKAELQALLNEHDKELKLHAGTPLGDWLIDTEPAGLKALQAAILKNNGPVTFPVGLFHAD